MNKNMNKDDMQPDVKTLREQFCPHCNETVSKTTFYSHRNLYYRNGNWILNKSFQREDDLNTSTDKSLASNLNNTCNTGRNDCEEAIKDFSVFSGPVSDIEMEDEVEKCISEIDKQESNSVEIWQEVESPEFDFEISPDVGSEKIKFLHPLLVLILVWQSKFSIADRAISSLLHIVKFIIETLASIMNSEKVRKILEYFPLTVATARKQLNLDSDSFVKFVCCPSCNKLFDIKDCLHSHSLARCDNIIFPNHSQERYRLPCNTVLMKKLISVDMKKEYLYPMKVYAYYPLKMSLELLLRKKEIRDALLDTSLRQGSCFDNVLADIYDGEVWKTFKSSDNQCFTKNSRNIALMLNIDWFQPFSNVEHSVGVIYLVVLNLPRDIRFKKENTLIVGIIPGPKEPEQNVNSFLKPLVNELRRFWKGQTIMENGIEQLYHAALIAISSDLPATRKCCGFLSYNSLKGTHTGY